VFPLVVALNSDVQAEATVNLPDDAFGYTVAKLMNIGDVFVAWVLRALMIISSSKETVMLQMPLTFPSLWR